MTLNKLYRFNKAPFKVKRHLYKALVRPILEYPAVTLSYTGITNKKKIQRIQNKATRLITNTKLNDRIRSEAIHNNAKMESMNIRLDKYSNKQLNKIHEKYQITYIKEQKKTSNRSK